MYKRYELIIYTSAEPEYANKILNEIEKHKKYFSYRLYKSHCFRTKNSIVFKNLGVLSGNRDIRNIILVDNRVSNYSMSITNGIPIKEYDGDIKDNELIYLAKYLRDIEEEADLSETIKYDLEEYLNQLDS